MPSIRPHYSKAPISEAVVDIVVEPSKEANTDQLRQLAESLKDRFPSMMPIRLLKMGFNVGEHPEFSNSQDMVGWRLTSQDPARVLQLQNIRFTYSHLPPYSEWQTFRSEAQGYWKIFRETYPFERATRVAVRVINHVALPENADIKEFLNVYPLVPDSLSHAADNFMQRVILDMSEFHPNSRAILAVANGEAAGAAQPRVVLDIDLFSDQSTTEDAAIWETLERFGTVKDYVFEACITEKLREMIR